MTQPHLIGIVPQAIHRSRVRAGWPLLAAVGFVAAGFPVMQRLAPIPERGPTTITLLALALIAMGCAAAALLKAPADRATGPFVGLASASAVLLAMASLDRPASSSNIAAFLLTAPWRYALPPLVVHFALEVTWPNRRGRWVGWVAGWYAIQLGAALVVAAGLTMDETPLVDAVDVTFRTLVAEPLSATAAIAVVLFALAAPTRGRSLRAPLVWTLLAIVTGFVPLVLAEILPTSTAAFGGEPARLALIALPAFGVCAVFTLPLRDDVARDLLGYTLAAAIHDGTDLPGALRQLAEALHNALGTRGVAVHLQRPDVVVTAGEAAATDAVAAPIGDVEEDRADLVVPIGRTGDPLGEVRLTGRTIGAFSTIERDWLAGLLQPVAAALRARRRDIAAAAQHDAQALQLRERFTDVRRGADQLAGSSPAADPPPAPVDAREVLAHLTDGVSGVQGRGADLSAAAIDARDHTRLGSDAVAGALDALAALAGSVVQLAQFNGEISTSNATVSDVAFRINLVANNAALEATRAGPSGRTFGVLAEEVRRLADTTASTSEAIGRRTAALAADLNGVATGIDRIRALLDAAIREAEGAELAAVRLKEAAAAVEDSARSLDPALREANDVAARRSARDAHLTASVERLFTERNELVRALRLHHDAIERLGRALGQPRG